MDENRLSIKGWLLVVCSGVVLYCGLQNLSAVSGAIKGLLGMLSPFLLGGALAFVLNVPMRAIERKLLTNVKKGARRPLALIFTLVCVVVVLALASLVIGPGIGEALSSLGDQIPTAVEQLQNQLTELQAYLPQIESWVGSLDIEWNTISDKAVELVKNWGSRLLSSGGTLIGGVVSGVSTFVIGLIFSFYLLLQKERLARQGRQCLYALLSVRRADRILEILRLANKTFSSFLSGQCLEAVILGALFVVVMTLFAMPYAVLVGVLIAFTALIPIVGAFIGCAVGAVLIAITAPWKALGFIVMFLILQQIEGNLIYPHVVGSSVGLPSIWVLAAVTIGGKLMGVVGMLLFIPLCSVLYALFRDFVKERLALRRIPEEKWKEPQ